MNLRHVLIAAAAAFGLAVPAIPASAATHPVPRVQWWASGTCNKTHQCVYHQKITRNRDHWWRVRAEAICSDNSVFLSDWHRAVGAYMTAPASGCGGPSADGYLESGFINYQHKSGWKVRVIECYTANLPGVTTGFC